MGQHESREIQETLAALRAAVRNEGGYLTEEEIPTGPQLSSIRDAADLASVSAHFPLQSTLPVVGPVIVLAQRIIRLGLRWYINPIVEQQNAFNDSVVRALTELELHQTELAGKVDALQKQHDRENE
ncbi:MAG: hypothetical protein WD401_00395 [Thermomicrobiaceae bacterium]